MADEPLFKKHFLSWFGGKKNDARNLETAVDTVTNIPQGLQKILGEQGHSEAIIKRKITSWIDREHVSIDIAGLEAYARKVKAADTVIQAIVGMRTSQHDLGRLDTRLQYKDNTEDRTEELGALQHETALLREREAQKQYRPSRLKDIAEKHRQVAEAERARAEAKAARAAGRAQEEPTAREEAKSAWEQLIEFHRDEIGGEEKFRRASDASMEEVRQAELAEIPADDPRREERIVRIEAKHRDRVRERDRLIRETWRRNQ